MGTWDLTNGGNYGRAKKAQEELVLQRRARQLAEQKRKKGSSVEAKKNARMVDKITKVKPVRERLEKRFSPRGHRRGDKAWTKTAYRVKVAHSAQLLWRDAEVRQAAYAALLKNFDPDLTDFMASAQKAHRRNKRSKVTPVILEDIRKKFKADSYGPKGSDLVGLFNKYVASERSERAVRTPAGATTCQIRIAHFCVRQASRSDALCRSEARCYRSRG